MGKTTNPYTRLQKRAFELFAEFVRYSPRIMYEFKPKSGVHYSLTEVLERTHAAQQLGKEVVVVAHGDTLRLEYRPKRPTEVPAEFHCY